MLDRTHQPSSKSRRQTDAYAIPSCTPRTGVQVEPESTCSSVPKPWCLHLYTHHRMLFDEFSEDSRGLRARGPPKFLSERPNKQGIIWKVGSNLSKEEANGFLLFLFLLGLRNPEGFRREPAVIKEETQPRNCWSTANLGI